MCLPVVHDDGQSTQFSLLKAFEKGDTVKTISDSRAWGNDQSLLSLLQALSLVGENAFDTSGNV